MSSPKPLTVTDLKEDLGMETLSIQLKLLLYSIALFIMRGGNSRCYLEGDGALIEIVTSYFIPHFTLPLKIVVLIQPIVL
ncbi:hypothetical protein BGZ60DRAFT_155874 [Tricladium varicosporioides]|nr:hypothetical protein BGZ60DRAFT_155874 [Hymenoscyphus varicosporioides]